MMDKAQKIKLIDKISNVESFHSKAKLILQTLGNVYFNNATLKKEDEGIFCFHYKDIAEFLNILTDNIMQAKKIIEEVNRDIQKNAEIAE